jgi:hypothetical protein
LLTDIELRALTSLGTSDGLSLLIDQSPELTAVDVGALGEVPGTIQLSSNGAIADKSLAVRFSTLTTVRGGLKLQSLANLREVNGFTKLSSVGADVTVSDNLELAELDGFAKLSEITGGLVVARNALLASATLDSLKKTGRGIWFQSNELLTDIDLHALTNIGASENLSLLFASLPKLNAVNLGALGEVPATIQLSTVGAAASGNLSLQLSALSIVRGNLVLDTVDTLSDLGAFAHLSSIAGSLQINRNSKLSSLAGLDSLQILSGSLSIVGNAELSTCVAKQLAMRLKPAGSSGTSTIASNKVVEGC